MGLVDFNGPVKIIGNVVAGELVVMSNVILPFRLLCPFELAILVSGSEVDLLFRCKDLAEGRVVVVGREGSDVVPGREV